MMIYPKHRIHIKYLAHNRRLFNYLIIMKKKYILKRIRVYVWANLKQWSINQCNLSVFLENLASTMSSHLIIRKNVKKNSAFIIVISNTFFPCDFYTTRDPVIIKGNHDSFIYLSMADIMERLYYMVNFLSPHKCVN